MLSVARLRARWPLPAGHDHSGSTAIIFGLTAAVVCVLAGGAVDLARWVEARSQTLTAIDAAVLAGARTLQLNPAAPEAAVRAAERYYAESTSGRLPLARDTITFRSLNGGTAFAASGTATIPTLFLKLADIHELPLVDAGPSELATAQIAAGRHATSNLEVALVLDTSDAMAGQRLLDLKAAAADLVDIIVWDDQSRYTSRLSLVPFASDVRLPSAWNGAARGAGLPGALSVGRACTVMGRAAVCTRQYLLSSCAVERKGHQSYTDAAPGPGQYVMAEYSPDGSCSQPPANEIAALTYDKSLLRARIEGLVPRGGSAGHLGAAWAWYTLSPNWAEVVPASGRPAAYGGSGLQKLAILVSGGAFDTVYDVNGIRSEPGGAPPANASSAEQAVSLCRGMKAQGIIVYAVGVGLAGNGEALAALSECATGPEKFYSAADGTELRRALRDIALELSTLHLVN